MTFRSTPLPPADFMTRPAEIGGPAPAQARAATHVGAKKDDSGGNVFAKTGIPSDPAAWTDAGPISWTQLSDGNVVIKQGKGGDFVSQGMPPLLTLLVKAARATDQERKKTETRMDANTLPAKDT